MQARQQRSAGRLGLVAALLFFTVASRPVTTFTLQTARPSPLVEHSFGRLPLAFEANQGQTDPRVRFLQRGHGHALFLARNESVLALQEGEGTSVLRMRLLGSEPEPTITGLDQLPGRSNYLIGSDPRRWRTGIARYATVKYENVYPGVDLVFHGRSDRLEYDLVVAPGVDPAIIRIGFQGSRDLLLDEQGDLILRVGQNNVVQHAPLVYQEADGIRKIIPGKYLLKGRADVGFAVDRATCDPARPLVIDPVLSYSSYLGGNGWDQANAIAVDASGSVYLVGSTSSANFPVVNPQQSLHPGSTDIFVAKLDPSGSSLVYSTYLGGSGSDVGSGVAIDGSGSTYVTGGTTSTDFPVAGAFQPAKAGTSSSDAFVAKLSPDGSALVFSTYLGGSNNDQGQGIAVDASGRAHVVGFTDSNDFPLENPLQTCRTGNSLDAFVTRFSPVGSALSFSTYVGGSAADQASDVALDPAGNVYVTGYTQSSDFPAVNALRATRVGSGADAFVLKIDASRLGFVYSTYLGGSDWDQGAAIAVDAAGDAFVTGNTVSTDFPLQDPVQPYFSAFGDGFVTKIDPLGSALVYSTYLGGNRQDLPRGIALDAAGQAHVIGQTWSTNFPLSLPLDSTPGSFGPDAFVTKLSADGRAFVYSTYLGGSGAEDGKGIALDAAGDAYIVGETSSYDFPTVNPFQGAHTDSEPDGFFAKILHDGPAPAPAPTPSPTSPSGRFEQDDASITYAGSWYSNFHCWNSHGSAVVAMDPGSSVTVTFSGTRIRWIGYRDEWSGIASVFLDGIFRGTVDTYATPPQYQTVLFAAAALDPGAHTLVIEATGTHGAASGGAWIWVDAFDVLGAVAVPIPDGDGDGIPDDRDCAPSDQSTWRAPSPARWLQVSGGPTGLDLVWQAPLDAGSATISYDVLRSADPAGFMSAVCVATAIPTTSVTVTPGSGNEFYLVRSRNACGGTLGADSNGAERPGAACP